MSVSFAQQESYYFLFIYRCYETALVESEKAFKDSFERINVLKNDKGNENKIQNVKKELKEALHRHLRTWEEYIFWLKAQLGVAKVKRDQNGIFLPY